jgi:opacity protein-like surface antigen
MLKKIIIAVTSASFLVSAAFADSTNIGVRLSHSMFGASGSETTDSGSINSGGAAVKHDKDANFTLPSVFVERQIEMNSGFSMGLGLDFVPLTAEIETLGGGDGTDAKIKAGNLVTAYLQPTFAVNETVSVYGKLGYAQGDLDISSITRQAGSASQTGDVQSTDGPSVDKDLEGPVYGLGVQMNNEMGLFSFIRLEASRTDFDEISHTNSNGKVLKADAEMDLITLTIGKSF